MLTRRRFLAVTSQAGAGLALTPGALAGGLARNSSTLVNDVHSRLNPTYVEGIARPADSGALSEVVRRANDSGRELSIAGGRHAMGGQQFGEGTLLIDTRAMNRIVSLDAERGLVEVEAGIQWPALINGLIDLQRGRAGQWGIIQKQTGADRLCLGGALGANVHGRGLRHKPIIDDIESFRLVDAEGTVINCSRTEHRELFSLVIGGYGLFGVVAGVTLRLAPRQQLQRRVEIIDVDELMPAFEQRADDGYVYGDCQFSIDPASDDFLNKGVFSCYRPVDPDVSAPAGQERLRDEQWQELYFLAHTDPARAFEMYSSFYLSTDGQVYWSDTHQLSAYTDNYHRSVDERMGTKWPATEMITEVYVPRPDLGAFLRKLAVDFRRHEVQVIYGTIRLIEEDDESFLPWAKQAYACVVMNLHVSHRPQAITKAAADFRRIIDRAIEHGGSFFLTYHRWATREQVETCYPDMSEFLALKRRYDPAGLFQSDWYRHYRRLFEQG